MYRIHMHRKGRPVIGYDPKVSGTSFESLEDTAKEYIRTLIGLMAS
jgi:hypothetical protein